MLAVWLAVTVTNTVSQTHQQLNPEAPIIVISAGDTVDVEASEYLFFNTRLCSPVLGWGTVVQRLDADV